MRHLRFAAFAALVLALPPTALALADGKGADRENAEQKKTDEEKIEPYELGQKVDPDIALPSIDGKTYRLGDHAGKIVVLDFWSIQCPWSIKYESKLKALHDEYTKKDVVFLAIDANHTEVDWDAEKPYARIREYLEKAEVPYPILIDEGNLVADHFGAMTTPHVFVLDGEGVLSYRGAIDDNPRGDESKETTPYVADALDALLAGEPVPEKDTKAFGCTIKRVKKGRLQ